MPHVIGANGVFQQLATLDGQFARILINLEVTYVGCEKERHSLAYRMEYGNWVCVNSSSVTVVLDVVATMFGNTSLCRNPDFPDHLRPLLPCDAWDDEVANKRFAEGGSAVIVAAVGLLLPAQSLGISPTSPLLQKVGRADVESWIWLVETDPGLPSHLLGVQLSEYKFRVHASASEKIPFCCPGPE